MTGFVRRLGTAAATVVMLTLVLGPGVALGQDEFVHGIGLAKGCEGATEIGDPYICDYTITNQLATDEAGDTLTITSLVDVINRPGSPSSGNILQIPGIGSKVTFEQLAGLEVVAWGLRNPYGLAFAPNGRLYATEHGSDARSKRQIIGDFDDLYLVEEGRWYGWPDFASGIRLDDPVWGPGGSGREPVLAEFPETEPPLPIVTFQPHAGANGLTIADDGAFGFAGQAFVALFGDLAPITTPRLATPVGFRVVRVDLDRREIVDFAINRIQGPASKLPHEGFERPSHCAFGPDGALYVTDFGEIDIAPEKAGIRVQAGTGTLWRIQRVTGEPAGERPEAPTVVPLYAVQNLVWIAALLGLVAGLGLLVRRLIRRLSRR